ncbi:hypothetical protein LMG26684_03907 [Achromobacter mucicolens]|uniref:AlbA family DNA-binding domain-containing protein n=1 Tax=Achromobacter mucicolens TaxID=1389922 RepID=UPI0014691A5B|nr:ATP-binding protein [Achromobacter mucicolens]CAB3887388.1 hypothetical protein LMG26684_03907 [Achromobacter mucicolens]
MVTKELLDALRYKSEGTDLDFKSEQYCFAGGTEHQKSEMLKDILSMANAWRDGTGYILLGFKDNRPELAEVVGISEQVDDSRFQQFINSKVKPKLTFRYEEHSYEGKTIGVIAIPKQKRPFFIAHPYGKLSRNVAYVRRGSSTEEAEPTEVAAMALADAGRGELSLDLSLLTPGNERISDKIALRYLQFPSELPDYQSPRTNADGFAFVTSATWGDNRHFLREYANYARIKAALIEMKFVLHNRSEVQLSSAKLEVSIEPLDGQELQVMAGSDLPTEPSSHWDTLAGLRTLPEVLERQQGRFLVENDGQNPICHVRFGTLLPGEQGRSSDTLSIIPAASGKMRLRIRILGSELSAPQESEHVIEALGEPELIDVDDVLEAL